MYGVALNADIQLEHEASLVRVVLVDDQSREHLLYEAYPLIAPESSFTVKKTFDEPWFTGAVTLSSLKIQVIDASITVHELLLDDVAKEISGDTAMSLSQQINDAQETIKIAGPGGGYILSSSNTIHPDVKPENAIAMYRAARKYGKYPIDL